MNAITGPLPWAFKGTVLPAVRNFIWYVFLATAPTADRGLLCAGVTPWSANAGPWSCVAAVKVHVTTGKAVLWKLILKRKKTNVKYLQ